MYEERNVTEQCTYENLTFFEHKHTGGYGITIALQIYVTAVVLWKPKHITTMQE